MRWVFGLVFKKLELSLNNLCLFQRAAHPSLIQRVNQLELRNRHLQNVIKQQQHYTENLLQREFLFCFLVEILRNLVISGSMKRLSLMIEVDIG